MKIVCFIGSGFNNMLADIVKPYNIYTADDTPLHEKLGTLNNLWNQLELLFVPFHEFIPNRYGEQMLEALDGIQTMLHKTASIGNIGSRFSKPTLITASHLIKEEMRKVGEHFTRFERNDGYAAIHKALPNFGRAFDNLLCNRFVSDLYICTTNYDGIVDSLLTYYCRESKGRKFILKDGFIYSRFNEEFFRNARYKIAHIHGSYRYFIGTSYTEKLNKGIINTNPLMIYDNPIRKESAILKNDVLSANYRELKRQLAECDKVITIGNSFRTEPHLQELIKRDFNRPNTQMVVCSNKPNEVVSVLEPYYDFPIYTKSTECVKSEEDLIELFSELLGTTDMGSLATA
jgi:NAD-dependent SIR2 family protein deacetylase